MVEYHSDCIVDCRLCMANLLFTKVSFCFNLFATWRYMRYWFEHNSAQILWSKTVTAIEIVSWRSRVTVMRSIRWNESATTWLICEEMRNYECVCETREWCGVTEQRSSWPSKWWASNDQPICMSSLCCCILVAEMSIQNGQPDALMTGYYCPRS